MIDPNGESSRTQAFAMARTGAFAAGGALPSILLEVGEAVLLHGPDGGILDANPAAERRLGWSRDELRGRFAGTLLWPGAYPRFSLLLEGCRHGRPVHNVAAVALTRSGVPADVLVSMSLLADGAGGPPGIATLIKPAGRAAKAAGEASLMGRGKDEFLATLGHELRNPLAALDGSVELLELGVGDPARIHPMLRKQVRQLSALVDDLLDVSRILRGKIRLHKSSVDLGALVEAAAQAVQGSVAEKGQHLVIRGTRAVRLEADPTRVQQIVANLLNNATKFTPSGGLIEVELGMEGGHALLRVRDSGPGMTPEVLEKIFEAFVQAQPGAGGLGIGLPLSRGLAELHGGTLRAESLGPGRGSAFTLLLPRGQPRATTAPEVAAERPELDGLAVLVVDDNRDAADSLVMLLQAGGCRAQAAYNGEDAIRRVAAETPDAVLLDLGLPDIDGYRVAGTIRTLAPATVLVAVTGYADTATGKQAAGNGFDYWLVKPVAYERLHALLHRRLGGRPRQPGAAAP